MRIDVPLAQYLLAATTALATGAPVPLPWRCEECKKFPDRSDGEHLTFLMPNGTVVVLVGCEGYHHIDPAALGLERGNWQTVEQCEADAAGVQDDDPPPGRRMQNEPGA